MITIGIPTYDDQAGLEWTLTSLIQYHDLSDIEILVCDNHPTSDKSKRPSKETQNIINLVAGVRGKYLPLPSPTGTAPPRNYLFEHASDGPVIIMDSHVSLQAGAIHRISDYLLNNPKDIVTGPRLSKSLIPGEQRLSIGATHYADFWRSEMWGIWAQAWGCPCKGFSFDISAIESPITDDLIVSLNKSQPVCQYHKLELGREVVKSCPSCGKELPQLNYIQHEKPLAELGYIRRGWSAIDTDPFEIPGLGLGMFAMMKESWPGFPKEMQGFGGGELHLHELVRRNGGKAVCLPQAGWWHSFHRIGGKVPYRLTLWDKVRNYVIWRKHLDMPLDPVYDHFVLEVKKLNDEQWNYLIADPVKNIDYPAHLKDIPVKKSAVKKFENIESFYNNVLTTKRDCISHLPVIKSLVESCDSVVSLVKRKEWDVAVCAGKPDAYISHNAEPHFHTELKALFPHYVFDNIDSLKAEPVECDLLLIDTQHTSARLSAELHIWGPYVKKWIALRGTKHFAYKDESGDGPGLLTAAKAWMDSNKQWKRVVQRDEQYGLTILSCDPAERSIDFGPGSQLHEIFDSLEVRFAEGCSCRAKVKEMDSLGPEGCKAKRIEFVDALKKDSDRYSWSTKFKAAYKAVATGLAFKLNPLDPIASCFDEAVRRSEAYEKTFNES